MHIRRGTICATAALILLWGVAVGAGATVSLAGDATAVAEGGEITFTCTIAPTTNVSRVTFSYADGSRSEVQTTAPFEVTHAFGTPMAALTVTATVSYSNGDADQEATTDVGVVGLTLSGSASPTRGYSVMYMATANPAGTSVTQFDWTFASGGFANTYTDYDADHNGISSWFGKMVVSGTLTVQATIGGVACSKQMAIDVAPRGGWELPLSCAQDNEPDWGDEPTELAGPSQSRDRDSNNPFLFLVPQPVQGDFGSAVSLTRVTSGPSKDWWYVSASSLACSRETVINKYIKSGGPAPAGALENFFDRNNLYCLAGTADTFVQAVKNHEFRGTPAIVRSENGHYGRTEKAVSDVVIAGDPKLTIESLTDRDGANLQSRIDDTIGHVESLLRDFVIDESFGASGPNWGGVGALGLGGHAAWLGSGWTECSSAPFNF